MFLVLLVQADSAGTRRWRTELASRGFDVIWVPGLQAAIKRLRQGGIDAILVEQPEVEELVDELHQLPDPPPFVWLSASPAAPRRSVSLGAAAFFPTPCNADDVEAIAGRLAILRGPSAPAGARAMAAGSGAPRLS